MNEMMVEKLFRSLFNSLPPLPRGLETLQALQEHMCFNQSMLMLFEATQRSKMFPNLSERHCIISLDSLRSQATVIQSELVEIHMHAFQGCRGGQGAVGLEEEEEKEDEGRVGSFI